MEMEMDHSDEISFVEDANKHLFGGNLLEAEDILDVAEPIRKKCGVYFLIAGGEIVYVGQSTDVDSRVRQHALDKDFESYHYIEVDQENLNYVESFYIIKLKPILNKKRGGKRASSGYRKKWMTTPLSRSDIFNASPEYCEIVQSKLSKEPIPMQGSVSRYFWDSHIKEVIVNDPGGFPFRKAALIHELSGEILLMAEDKESSHSWSKRVKGFALSEMDKCGTTPLHPEVRIKDLKVA